MPLSLQRTSPTTLVLTRRFSAPPNAVWDAHMKPELIREWLCGDGGTAMPVCENDPRVGGHIRYEWREPDDSGFYLTGVYEVVDAPHRTVHVETMYLPDPMPENRIETRFEPDGTGTLLTMTMTLPDAAAMDAMVASGMGGGMEGCYARLDRMPA
jgi:uncharacterized protein YndB with AHSA1/START domain